MVSGLTYLLPIQSTALLFRPTLLSSPHSASPPTCFVFLIALWRRPFPPHFPRSGRNPRFLLVGLWKNPASPVENPSSLWKIARGTQGRPSRWFGNAHHGSSCRVVADYRTTPSSRRRATSSIRLRLSSGAPVGFQGRGRLGRSSPAGSAVSITRTQPDGETGSSKWIARL